MNAEPYSRRETVKLGLAGIATFGTSRAWAVDMNGFAQPETRSIAETRRNGIQVKHFEISA